MKVTTIDGGFRGRKGLAAASVGTQQQLAAVDDFQSRLTEFDRTSREIVTRLRDASLPQAEAVELDRALTEMRSTIDAHVAASSNISSSEELMAWRTEAGRLVSLANRFVQHARQSVLAETATRPWKVVLALALGTAVLGAAAWSLARLS